MNVLLINGSPHCNGNTYAALAEVAAALEANGVKTEIFSIGTAAVQGCIACNGCAETGECLFGDALYLTVRGGASAAFDRLNKYFTINNMPVVPSQYWNSVHGCLPGEAARDAEGMQTMRTLGRNMAWMLKGLRDGSLPLPDEEPGVTTSFIR